jgi:hypothetical protein
MRQYYHLLNGGLLEGMISNDRVLAASMASSAVGVENLLARVEVASESRGGHKEGSAGSGDLRHIVLLAGHAHAGSLHTIIVSILNL